MAPTQIVKCLEEFKPGKYNLESWQAVCYGGGPIYVEHLKKAVETFGPVFVQIYGQGECPTSTSVRVKPAEASRGPKRYAAAGCTPAMSGSSIPVAICFCSTGPRT
jgi:acyl-coenzyme A synthetase/AMP-(fatty) acid ligase